MDAVQLKLKSTMIHKLIQNPRLKLLPQWINEGIIELLNISDADLKDDAPALAAKNFFKRFRRPVDALAEIGAAVVVGPTQNQKLDFVKDYNLRKGWQTY